MIRRLVTGYLSSLAYKPLVNFPYAAAVATTTLDEVHGMHSLYRPENCVQIEFDNFKHWVIVICNFKVEREGEID